MKHVTRISDLSSADVETILNRAEGFRQKYHQGIRRDDCLQGKVVAMVFEKPSLRTKVAFEVAATYLGGTPVFLSSSQILASGNNVRGRESIPDIGRNLERFCDLIVARVYRHETIRELCDSIGTPVINALCDRHHPTQALADLYALRLKKPGRKKLKVAYVGDGNNVATSLMQICALTGLDFSIASPQGYEIPAEEQDAARGMARDSGAELSFLRKPEEAVAGADAIYTDTFVSMGQEEERERRQLFFQGYQVDAELLRLAKPDAVFMHCLPAHRGEEVTDEVMDCEQSIVFEQAECRLHIAKALIAEMLGS